MTVDNSETPKSPKPSLDAIESVFPDLAEFLADQDSDTGVKCSTNEQLNDHLRSKTHGTSSIEWAIHEGCERGLLTRSTVQEERVRLLGPNTVTTRAYALDIPAVQATEQLWESRKTGRFFKRNSEVTGTADDRPIVDAEASDTNIRRMFSVANSCIEPLVKFISNVKVIVVVIIAIVGSVWMFFFQSADEMTRAEFQIIEEWVIRVGQFPSLQAATDARDDFRAKYVKIGDDRYGRNKWEDELLAVRDPEVDGQFLFVIDTFYGRSWEAETDEEIKELRNLKNDPSHIIGGLLNRARPYYMCVRDFESRYGEVNETGVAPDSDAREEVARHEKKLLRIHTSRNEGCQRTSTSSDFMEPRSLLSPTVTHRKRRP